MDSSEKPTDPDAGNGKAMRARIRQLEAAANRYETELYGEPGKMGGIKPLLQAVHNDHMVLTVVTTETRLLARIVLGFSVLQFGAFLYLLHRVQVLEALLRHG